MKTNNIVPKLSELREAIDILLKYGDTEYPTYCWEDELEILVNPNNISKEDLDRLKELHFVPAGLGEYELPHLVSKVFGNCIAIKNSNN